MQATPSISKLLVVGPKGSGKTSLLCRLINQSMDECDHTNGQFAKFNFSQEDGRNFTFLLKEVNVLPTTEKKAGYILTLNSNNKSDLDSLPNVLSMITDRKYIIALCMADLHYSATFWIDDVKKVIGKKGINIVPISSKTGQNIKELLSALVNMVSN